MSRAAAAVVVELVIHPSRVTMSHNIVPVKSHDPIRYPAQHRRCIFLRCIFHFLKLSQVGKSVRRHTAMNDLTEVMDCQGMYVLIFKSN